MECIVCFEELNDKLSSVECSTVSCECRICSSCFEQFINFAYSSGNLPVCPGNNCDGIYEYQVLIKNLDSNVFYTYARAVANYYSKLNAKEINFNVRKTLTIDQLRVEKLDFLKRSFPSGVLKLCSITSPEKLKRIRKLEGKLFGSITKGQACPLAACEGLLTSDTKTCILCRTKFCQNCMKQQSATHVCREEDIQVLRELNAYIRCPGCVMPIFKDVGCSSVTCSNCHTHFLYQAKCPLCQVVTNNTQKGSFHCLPCDHVFQLDAETSADNGGHGSRNVKTKMKKDHLVDSYKELISSLPESKKLFSLLRDLEITYKPKKASDKKLKKVLIELELNQQEDSPEDTKRIPKDKKLLILIVRHFDDFYNQRHLYETYIRDINVLENKIRTKKLTPGFVRRILSKYVN